MVLLSGCSKDIPRTKNGKKTEDSSSSSDDDEEDTPPAMEDGFDEIFFFDGDRAEMAATGKATGAPVLFEPIRDSTYAFPDGGGVVDTLRKYLPF
ncbi:opioid growth factor receptor-like protein 1-like protein [Corchorus capsularis]|uniref:Opioid growth factor receptor-like protein 1-like protein n=1 Tax=Corchorus capsularis TaxID=210143 RepID=A0A1R3GUM9_COCAP|nr:opioid growth factor receptor-like protein 1-like protein [Corchorus capsularis]